MEKPNIVLTGFMGTGKTTVGKLLAKQLSYEFVDTDDLIQERAGKTIPEIFKDLGETAFREMEARIARELAKRQGVVIATGGKLMLVHENAKVLEQTGRVFCLTATPDEIYQRFSEEEIAFRPLLRGPDARERIGKLLEERRQGYGRFHQVITSGRKPMDIVAGIKELL